MAWAFVLTVRWLAAANLAGAPVQSTPASQPVLAEPRTSLIRLEVEGRPDASYWLRRPAGHGPGQKPPLLICLHGTDDTARDMVTFWGGLRTPLPLVIAAPQGVAPGWRDEDLPTIRAMLEHLRRYVPHDPRRVLLAGFSAGGAMGFRLLYKEKLPVTAVAVLANYVPPSIGWADVRERAAVPVFYAVGMTDVNHERMRDGIDLLRNAGGDVSLYRPPVGHVLDAQVAQAAVDWMFEQSARQVRALVERSGTDDNIERASLQLEEVVNQAAWHEPGHVELAHATLDKVETRARQDIAAASKMVNEGRLADAYERLVGVRAAYGRARSGQEADALAGEVLVRPGVAEQVNARAAQRRADEAMSVYAGAQRLVADRRYADAMKRCDQIIRDYADTPAAGRARYLRDLLQTTVPRE